MTNGVYIASDRMYNSKRRLCVFQDSVKVYTLQGNYVCLMSEQQATEMFGPTEMWDKVTKANQLCNLVWMVDGHIKECVKENISYALANHTKRMLGDQYKPGLLMTVPSNLS